MASKAIRSSTNNSTVVPVDGQLAVESKGHLQDFHKNSNNSRLSTAPASTTTLNFQHNNNDPEDNQREVLHSKTNDHREDNIIGCWRIVPKHSFCVDKDQVSSRVEQQQLQVLECIKRYFAISTVSHTADHRSHGLFDKKPTMVVENNFYRVEYTVEYVSEDLNNVIVLTLSAITTALIRRQDLEPPHPSMKKSKSKSSSLMKMKSDAEPTTTSSLPSAATSRKSGLLSMRLANLLSTGKAKKQKPIIAVFTDREIKDKIANMIESHLMKMTEGKYGSDGKAITMTTTTSHEKMQTDAVQHGNLFKKLFYIEKVSDHVSRYLSPKGQSYCNWVGPKNITFCNDSPIKIEDRLPSYPTKTWYRWNYFGQNMEMRENEKNEIKDNLKCIYVHAINHSQCSTPLVAAVWSFQDANKQSWNEIVLYQLYDGKQLWNRKIQIGSKSSSKKDEKLKSSWDMKKDINGKDSNNASNTHKKQDPSIKVLSSAMRTVGFVKSDANDTSVGNSTCQNNESYSTDLVLIIGCGDGLVVTIPTLTFTSTNRMSCRRTNMMPISQSVNGSKRTALHLMKAHGDSVTSIFHYPKYDLLFTTSNDHSFCIMRWMDQNSEHAYHRLNPLVYSTHRVINDVAEMINIQLSIAVLPSCDSAKKHFPSQDLDIFTSGWSEIRYWKSLEQHTTDILNTGVTATNMESFNKWHSSQSIGQWETYFFPCEHSNKKVGCIDAQDITIDFDTSTEKCKSKTGSNSRSCRILVSGSVDKTAIVWDISNPREPTKVRQLIGHDGEVSVVKILKSRPIIVTGSLDCTIRCWDLFSGATMRMINMKIEIQYLDIIELSSDSLYQMTGEMIVAGNSTDCQSINVWNCLNNHREIAQYVDKVLDIAICTHSYPNDNSLDVATSSSTVSATGKNLLSNVPVAFGTGDGRCIISVGGKTVEELTAQFLTTFLSSESDDSNDSVVPLKSEEATVVDDITSNCSQLVVNPNQLTNQMVNNTHPSSSNFDFESFFNDKKAQWGVKDEELCDCFYPRDANLEKGAKDSPGSPRVNVVIAFNYYGRHIIVTGMGQGAVVLWNYDANPQQSRFQQLGWFEGDNSTVFALAYYDSNLETVYPHPMEQQWLIVGGYDKDVKIFDCALLISSCEEINNALVPLPKETLKRSKIKAGGNEQELVNAHSKPIRSILVHYSRTDKVPSIFVTTGYDQKTIVWHVFDLVPLYVLQGLHDQFILSVKVYDPDHRWFPMTGSSTSVTSSISRDNSKAFCREILEMKQKECILPGNNASVVSSMSSEEGAKLKDHLVVITAGYDGKIGIWCIKKDELKQIRENQVKAQKGAEKKALEAAVSAQSGGFVRTFTMGSDLLSVTKGAMNTNDKRNAKNMDGSSLEPVTPEIISAPTFFISQPDGNSVTALNLMIPQDLSSAPLIIAGSIDNLIYVWNLYSLERVNIITGHSNRVNALALVNNQTVATARGLLWNSSVTGNSFGDVPLDDDELLLLSGSDDGCLLYWEDSLDCRHAPLSKDRVIRSFYDDVHVGRDTSIITDQWKHMKLLKETYGSITSYKDPDGCTISRGTIFEEFPFLFYLALIERQESFFIEFAEDLKRVVMKIPAFPMSMTISPKLQKKFCGKNTSSNNQEQEGIMSTILNWLSSCSSENKYEYASEEDGDGTLQHKRKDAAVPTIDILSYAIHTRSLIALRALLVSWKYALNQDITDSLSQKLLLPTYAFNEDVLIELSRTFPVEYADFLASLQLVRNHASSECVKSSLVRSLRHQHRMIFVGSNEIRMYDECESSNDEDDHYMEHLHIAYQGRKEESISKNMRVCGKLIDYYRLRCIRWMKQNLHISSTSTPIMDWIYWTIHRMIMFFIYQPKVIDQPVMPFSLPIKRIATIAQLKALIETSTSLQSVDFFEGPAVRLVIRHYWETYGWKKHAIVFVKYCITIVAFVACIHTFPMHLDELASSSSSSTNDHNDSNNTIKQARRCIIFFIVMMILYALDETAQLISKCRSLDETEWEPFSIMRLAIQHFIGDIWNCIDFVIIISGLIGSGIRLRILSTCSTYQHFDQWRIISTSDQRCEHNFATTTMISNCILAVTAVMLWFKVLYFLRPTKEAGPFVVMVITIINDIKYFLLVLACVLTGFAQGFWLILSHRYSNQQSKSDDSASLGIGNTDENVAFRDVKSSFFSTFMFMFGQLDSQQDILSGNDQNGTTDDSNIHHDPYVYAVKIFTKMFLVTFLLTMMILMLNLLIALMGDSFARTKENIRKIYRKELVTLMVDQSIPTPFFALFASFGLLNYEVDDMIYLVRYTSDIRAIAHGHGHGRDQNEDEHQSAYALEKSLEVCKQMFLQDAQYGDDEVMKKVRREDDVIDR